MLRSGLARVVSKTSLKGALAALPPVTQAQRYRHRGEFLTPASATALSGVPAKEFPVEATTVPLEFAGFTLSPDLKVMHTVPHTPKQKKMSTTANGDPRFFFTMSNHNDPYVIKAEVRDSWSNESNEYNRMRVGRIPCVINSPKRNNAPMNIWVDPIEMQVLSEYRNINNAVYHVEVEGYAERFRCFVRDYTLDSASGKVIHVSFMIAESGAKCEVRIPVMIEGGADAVAVKRGALLLQPIRHLTVEYDHAMACKLGVGAPPRSVHVNVVDCAMGDTVHTHDIGLPPFLRLDDRMESYRHVLCTFKKL